ncbi:putative integral membrane pth11-like protein [Rosellinia necatrix]|uniref:Putative integral membrane pth11-like protein n=1 Tax=Rosellinia necatrix TaxID=77044 RepID=A0A1S7UKG7_ROSNE|nr:putative integral membrane pth11-like protein [Rosellinia necatrix]
MAVNMAETVANNTITYSAEYLAEDRTALVTAFYALPIPLEILTTLFRLWVKVSPNSDGRLGYDDYLIVWATITAVAECVAGLVYGPPKGLGRHVQVLEPESISEYLRGDYIFSHFYDFAIVSTKLSILALYYHIFATPKMRAVVLTTAILVFAWLIEMEIVLGFGCRPIQGWWDASVAATAKCVDKVAFTYSTNILNLIFDIWIFSMPIPIISRLQVNRGKRIALGFLFSIGLGVCGLSIARLSVVFSAGSGDVTWEEVPLGILSALEPCGAILCANLPILYRTISRGYKHVRGTFRGTGDASYGTADLSSPHSHARGQDWARINPDSHKRVSGFPKVTVSRGDTADSEQELTANGGIKIEREFELQSRVSTRNSNHDTVT